MYSIAGINTKLFWNIPKGKYFAPLRMLNLFIKSFVNPFLDIALTFFGSSFNVFLFDATFFSLLSKSVNFLNQLVLILQQNFLMLTY